MQLKNCRVSLSLVCVRAAETKSATRCHERLHVPRNCNEIDLPGAMIRRGREKSEAPDVRGIFRGDGDRRNGCVGRYRRPRFVAGNQTRAGAFPPLRKRTTAEHAPNAYLEQFGGMSRRPIVWPDKYKTGSVIYPYAVARR